MWILFPSDEFLNSIIFGKSQSQFSLSSRLCLDLFKSFEERCRTEFHNKSAEPKFSVQKGIFATKDKGLRSKSLFYKIL